ncbi:MAG TPA: hypothetical protein VF533_19585 [Solirubrobacteraceae bacterium]|jgi:hypothetical protein
MPARYEDDDDWVGTPPEGHHTRDQSNPGFWSSSAAIVPGIGVLILILIVLVLVLVT